MYAARGYKNKPYRQRKPTSASIMRAPIVFSARRYVPPAPGHQVPRGFITTRAADAKFFDTAAATYNCDTTGTITHLSIVPQGTTVNSREGKSFRCTALQIRGQFQAGTTTTASTVAAYIVWDKQPNKALAAITDIFNSISSESLSKRENAGRFVLLKKYIRVLIGNSTTPATGQEYKVIEKYMKMPPNSVVECTAADTTGVIGNTINGALLLVTMGTVAAGTASGNFFGTFRLGFTDRN